MGCCVCEMVWGRVAWSLPFPVSNLRNIFLTPQGEGIYTSFDMLFTIQSNPSLRSILLSFFETIPPNLPFSKGGALCSLYLALNSQKSPPLWKRGVRGDWGFLKFNENPPLFQRGARGDLIDDVSHIWLIFL